ncbi:MAG TPA: 50S ribosomal protein L18 [Thermoplasmata archaeon]|jgi:large subunit ribosomal protein L18|nr:50S ribosomal protein L18 [Thermoplasmata archaeon]
MVGGTRQRVPFRRRREGRTDYRRRLKLLRSGLARAVVRKSLNQTQIQIVGYTDTGDRVLATATSNELRELGWNGGTGNVPAAYLTGLMAGHRAAKAGVTKAVLDLGLQKPSKGGRLFAAAKGLVDAGIEMPHGDGVFPAEPRIRGEHLGEAKAKEIADVRAKVGAT